MSEISHYEILVIGSGEAGKHLTWNLAQFGRRTAVVERKYIGGSCPNIACLPSKNVIRSAKANWFARHGVEYGIQTGPVSTDMKGVFERKRNCGRKLRIRWNRCWPKLSSMTGLRWLRYRFRARNSRCLPPSLMSRPRVSVFS